MLARRSGGLTLTSDYDDRCLGEYFTEANVKDALWAGLVDEREEWELRFKNSINLNNNPDFYRSI